MKIATSSVLVTYLREYVVARFIHSHCSSCKVRIQSPFYDASTSSKEGLNEKTIQRCVLIMGRYVEQVQRRRGTAAGRQSGMGSRDQYCMVWDTLRRQIIRLRLLLLRDPILGEKCRDCGAPELIVLHSS